MTIGHNQQNASKHLEWVKDIKIDDLLDKDSKLVYDYCGVDVLIELMMHFPSIPLYIGKKVLNRIRERYIKQFFTGNNIKDLCVKIGVSERFVYKIIGEGKIDKSLIPDAPDRAAGIKY